MEKHYSLNPVVKKKSFVNLSYNGIDYDTVLFPRQVFTVDCYLEDILASVKAMYSKSGRNLADRTLNKVIIAVSRRYNLIENIVKTIIYK